MPRTVKRTPEGDRWSRILPSPPEWVAIVIATLLPLTNGKSWLSLDGDPGRHIRVGETILRSGLFYHDPFSFTKPGAPFVPYEWLSEVLSAMSTRVAGLPGFVVLTGAVLACTYAVVARTLIRRGVRPILVWLTLLFVMAIGIVHWHARPHTYTLLCVAVLMTLIDRAAERSEPVSAANLWSAAWPAIPLFALWANLHGGFLYGLFLIAAVVVGDRLEMLAAASAERKKWRDTLLRHAAMLPAAAAACLLTPSGPGLLAHTVGYLRDSYLVNHTQEYLSPDFHVFRFALIAITLVVGALALLPRRAPYPTIVLVVLNLAFALISARNLPVFGIVVLPLVAAQLELALSSRALDKAPRRTTSGEGHRARLAIAWPVAAVIAMFFLARAADRAAATGGQLSVGGRELFFTTFNPRFFPVRAVQDARAAGLTGRIFHEFTWGGYVLYAWPEQRVFIDGQTDFYGDSVTKEYMAMYMLEPGWRAKLAAWRIDLSLLPTASPLADALAHEPGWRPIHCDSTAVLFARDSSRVAALGELTSLPDACASLALSPLRVAGLSRKSVTPQVWTRH